MAEEFLKEPPDTPRMKILVSAWDLFHEQGIERTSVDEILKASGTGKSQFYHYFGSKDGLVGAAMEEARKLIKEGGIKGWEPITSWNGLREWFDFFMDKCAYYDNTRSCPIGRFAAELSKEDEEFRKDVLLLFEAKKIYPKEFFLTLKAKGELKEDADPDSMADFCQAVLQGAGLLAKVHKDTKSAKHVLNHAFQHLKSFAK